MGMTPAEAAHNVFERARELLAASTVAGVSSSAAADLRRLGLVMGVAGLDTYLHALVLQHAYATTPMPKNLAQLDVRFDDLVGLADQAVSARRREVDGRPRVAAKNLLQKRLARETFQKADAVSNALAMAGKSKSWATIAGDLNSTAEVVKAQLNAIVARRNQIVHEGDLQRQSRPRSPKLNQITLTDARRCVNYIERIVDAIDRLP